MRIPRKVLDIPWTRPAILLMHGLESSADQWVLNSPDKASAFNLVEAGYDVWMGNNRGNYYSTKHVTLDPYNATDAPAFWDFDFEDMGLKDLPAFIDFILNTTSHTSLSYVGHSEGTTQLFIGSSMMPDYFQEKVNIMIALAPVANLAHTPSSFLQILAQF